MKKLLACLLGCLVVMPSIWADELTDAMTNADPRDRLESGQGVVYWQAYAPEEPSPLLEELEPIQVPSLRYSYGEEYEGWRSPLYQPETEEESSPETARTPRSTTVSPLPLGKPEQREGVWYQDDIRP